MGIARETQKETSSIGGHTCTARAPGSGSPNSPDMLNVLGKMREWMKRFGHTWALRVEAPGKTQTYDLASDRMGDASAPPFYAASDRSASSHITVL
jgi:hypothetical protein